jgi:ribosome-binding ATPase YchF (GTP1/OBG family)
MYNIAAIEAEIIQLDDDEKQEFMDDLGLEEPIVFDELTQSYPDFINAQKALYVHLILFSFLLCPSRKLSDNLISWTIHNHLTFVNNN